MSYYFNIIYDFLAILLYYCFVYQFPISQKGFFVTVKSVKPYFAVCAYVLIYLFFDFIFSKTLLVSSSDMEKKSRS